MHFTEAEWIRTQLIHLPKDLISPCLNLGSSTLHYRTVSQPFIERLIFAPLNLKGVIVNHSDIKNSLGVDLAGNISDERFRNKLQGNNYRCIIMSNFLEHVPDPYQFIRHVDSILHKGAFLIITSPYKYPIHMDPIDNLFRPSPTELSAEFPSCITISSQILRISPKYIAFLEKPHRFFLLLLRCLIPFYKPRGWLTALYTSLWMFRERQISCVVLRKSS